MAVASVSSDDKKIGVIAFATNKTKNKDAFVVFNKSAKPASVEMKITGTVSREFSVFRTSNNENYKELPDPSAKNGTITYRCPPNSATTFFGK